VQVDPIQNNNLADRFPEVVEKMSLEYEGWWEDVMPLIQRKAEDPRWSQNYNLKEKQN